MTHVALMECATSRLIGCLYTMSHASHLGQSALTAYLQLSYAVDCCLHWCYRCTFTV